MRNTIAIIICLTGVLFSCSYDDTLRPVCGNYDNMCYGVWEIDGYQDPQLVSAHHASTVRWLADDGLVGQCKMGVPTCDDDYNIIACDGAVYPENKDPCDGVDNNCNGRVDDDLYPYNGKSWFYEKDNNPCHSAWGVCGDGIISCFAGKFICNLPDSYQEIETKCDGLDNDCDVLTDEPDNMVFEAPFCYGGENFYEAFNPPCHPGTNKCIDGEEVCFNYQAPVDEVCGDRIDNDCNGFIDDALLVKATEIDFVIILDNSTSMYWNIIAAKNALSGFIDTPGVINDRHRFAIVSMSAHGYAAYQLDTDFGRLEDVIARLDNLEDFGTNAYENPYGAAIAICDVVDNTLELSWAPNSGKAFLMFTDDTDRQQYPLTEQNVIDKCVKSGVIPFIWADNFSVGFRVITSPLTSGGAGGMFFSNMNGDLDIKEAAFFDNLNSIEILVCEN